jgi:hypothetical protein
MTQRKWKNQKRNRVLALLFAGVLMGALDIAIVGPALPAIRQQFGVDARRLAWIFSAYVLFNLVGTPLMAKLSDLYGRRWIYVLDVGLFAGGSLLVATGAVFEIGVGGTRRAGFWVERDLPGGFGRDRRPLSHGEKRWQRPGDHRRRVWPGLPGGGPLLGGLLLPLGWQWFVPDSTCRGRGR